MGIKNLHKFLRKYAENAYRDIHLSAYMGKRVAVDANIYLFKYKSAFKERWVYNFVHLIALLKHAQLDLVFIYDTKAPVEKDLKKYERKLRKHND